MLTISVPRTEWFDENRMEFFKVEACTLQLEHSLISLSKWESKWKKPYLNPSSPITRDEFIDYVRCMTISRNVNPLVYEALTPEQIDLIQAYINDKMTATWFSKDQRKNGVTYGRIVTSELIYYWMIAQNIPAEYQKWHLNRLLTLIEVCNAENAPKGKMSQNEILRRNKELNDQRRRSMHTHG